MRPRVWAAYYTLSIPDLMQGPLDLGLIGKRDGVCGCELKKKQHINETTAPPGLSPSWLCSALGIMIDFFNQAFQLCLAGPCLLLRFTSLPVLLALCCQHLPLWGFLEYALSFPLQGLCTCWSFCQACPFHLSFFCFINSSSYFR